MIKFVRPPTEAELVLFKAAGKDFSNVQATNNLWCVLVNWYVYEAEFDSYEEMRYVVTNLFGLDSDYVDKLFEFQLKRHNLTQSECSKAFITDFWRRLLDWLGVSRPRRSDLIDLIYKHSHCDLGDDLSV